MHLNEKKMNYQCHLSVRDWYKIWINLFPKRKLTCTKLTYISIHNNEHKYQTTFKAAQIEENYKYDQSLIKMFEFSIPWPCIYHHKWVMISEPHTIHTPTPQSQLTHWTWLAALHWEPGPRLNIKTVLSMYGDFHIKDKTAVRTSYL